MPFSSKHIARPAALTLLVAAFASTFFASTFVATPTAYADEILMPIVGRQFLTAGLALNPGIVYDSGAPNRTQSNSVAPTAATNLRLGIHHILSTSFSMSGEFEIGSQWLSPNTISTDASLSDREIALNLQVGLMARWFPLEQPRGWTAGIGSHYYRAWLDQAPLHILALEARIGRFIWVSDERFLIVELGYGFPFVQGLSQSAPIIDDDSKIAERTWSFQRFSLGFNLTW